MDIQVTVTMTDLLTDELVTRTIHGSNLMVPGRAFNAEGWECNVMGSKEAQQNNLEKWINNRANEQHDTYLELKSWEYELNGTQLFFA